MKKLLVLGSSNGCNEIVLRAKERKIYTIVTDNLPQTQSSAKLLSDEFWMISTGDIKSISEKCREEGIDGVIAGASDFNVDMQIKICENLGLPCFADSKCWHYSKDKADFKSICKKIGAPVPKDYIITNQLSDAELDNIEFPVMVKPVDMSGNRGISYCYCKEDVINAYRYARSVSKNNKIIVERMLHGNEWWAGYVIANGMPRLISLNAMYSQPGNPKNCYTLTTTISDNVKLFIDNFNPKIEDVLKAVGCVDGYAWIQLMLDKDGKFYIIEMGHRLTGEGIFIPFQSFSGFSIIDWLIDCAIGIRHSIEDLPKSQTGAFKKICTAMMLWTNKDGVVKEINGFDKLEDEDLTIISHVKIGDCVTRFKALGNVLFNSPDFESFVKKVTKINNTISIINEKGEDIVIKYTDFDYLRKIYEDGLAGK